jgi:hypothetical protein
MTKPYPLCTCDEPMPNDEQDTCLLCGLKFAPPPLGVSVEEKVNANEKIGN